MVGLVQLYVVTIACSYNCMYVRMYVDVDGGLGTIVCSYNCM
jgi:hypothetical protein